MNEELLQRADKIGKLLEELARGLSVKAEDLFEAYCFRERLESIIIVVSCLLISGILIYLIKKCINWIMTIDDNKEEQVAFSCIFVCTVATLVILPIGIAHIDNIFVPEPYVIEEILMHLK